MINDFLTWDMKNLTLQQIEQLHAMKQIALAQKTEEYIKRRKATHEAELLKTWACK